MHRTVEPRIEALKREIERILSLVEFEHNGQPIKPDSFRLRDLSNWRTDIAMNSFEALFPSFDSSLTLKEAETRLRHFFTENKRCLFHARHCEEIPFNEKTLTILMKARIISPSELFIVTVKNSSLTADKVESLSGIKPLLIKLVITSTNIKKYKTLKGSNIPLKAIELLQKVKIPFVAGIIAGPEVKSDELKKIIKEISTFHPYGISIRLLSAHNYNLSISEKNAHRRRSCQ